MANTGGVDPVKAALERLKAKKAAETVPEAPEVQAKPNGEPDNSDLMAQRRARRLAKQAEQVIEKSENIANVETEGTSDAETDPRKATVAAALARAKAKKEAQQAVEKSENIANSETGIADNTETDPRKAAVAAAIARAKAKKSALEKSDV